MAQPIAMVASAARTTSGSQVVQGLQEYDKLRVQLNVSAASGTTPTLDVVVEDTVDAGATWNTVATFAQKTAAAREVLTISPVIGDQVRVSWTIAGSTPSFTFAVSGLAERASG